MATAKAVQTDPGTEQGACPECGRPPVEDGPMAAFWGSDRVWLACEEGHSWVVPLRPQPRA